MISMSAVFFMFLILFGFIGANRGWAKEILVVASVILALAVITLIEQLLGLGRLFANNLNMQYWIRMGILIMLVFFGYQSPKVQRIAKATERRGQIGERLLSFLFGMVSGFFVIGTAWAFSWDAGYPSLIDQLAAAPPEIAATIERIHTYLPPVWLNQPLEVFVALVVIFIFVIIYFV
jgi:hypothetical protein